MYLYTDSKLNLSRVWRHLLNRDLCVLVDREERLGKLSRFERDFSIAVWPHHKLKCWICTQLVGRVLKDNFNRKL